MSNPVIEFKEVSKFYGNILGLNDITVSIGNGMCGLLGPNGAGKSTMLKLITGQISPSRGIIRVFEERPWDSPSLNNRIGYCPEQDSFFKGMTGRQFVTFGGRMLGMGRSKAESLALEAIEKVEMRKVMDRSISGYSKGMRQKIKIAQSLINGPELLVLDEPLAGTDPLGRIKIMELLFDLRKEGVNIIVSSHVLYEIERLTEDVVIINKGKLIAEGIIQEIRDSMDRFPLTVRIRAGARRELASSITGFDDLTSMTFGDDLDELLVRTKDPLCFYNRFQKMVVDKGMEITAIDSPDDNLDAIFRYLVE